MGVAAYRVLIHIGGSPMPVRDEALVRIDRTNDFQLDRDGDIEVFQHSSEVVIKSNYDGDVNNLLPDEEVVDSGLYTFNRVSGRFSFLNLPEDLPDTVTVSVSGTYIPLALILKASSHSLEISATMLDKTNTSDAAVNGGYKTREHGLLDVSASISRFYDANPLYRNTLMNRQPVMLSFNLTGGVIARGWFVTESDNISGEVDGLETEEIQFQLDGQTDSVFTWINN